MPAIFGGMITEYWARHPMTRLRRTQRDRQRLSEYYQVIGQLLRPGRLMVTPNVSFGKPFSEADLRAEDITGSVLPAVIKRVRTLLDEHCETFYCRAAN